MFDTQHYTPGTATNDAQNQLNNDNNNFDNNNIGNHNNTNTNDVDDVNHGADVPEGVDAAALAELQREVARLRNTNVMLHDQLHARNVQLARLVEQRSQSAPASPHTPLPHMPVTLSMTPPAPRATHFHRFGK